MPLRDHFRSPVNDKHRWDEVHGQWLGMAPPPPKLLSSVYRTAAHCYGSSMWAAVTASVRPDGERTAEPVPI